MLIGGLLSLKNLSLLEMLLSLIFIPLHYPHLPLQFELLYFFLLLKSSLFLLDSSSQEVISP
jgi:hypothetical protein